MPSPDLLSFDALLAPISADAPAGADARTSSALRARFDKIADAFDAAEGTEKQEAEAAAADDSAARSSPTKLWGPVIGPAVELLSGQTKDLQVAGWLRFPTDEILIYGSSLCIVVPFLLELGPRQNGQPLTAPY